MIYRYCSSLITTLTNADLTALYRYWNPSVSDHFYTTNINEIGTATAGEVGKHGYRSEGAESLVYTGRVTGTVPLYRYWNSALGDHFYTTASSEIGTTAPGETGQHGYVSKGIVGYCFPSSVPGTVPLHRYWSGGDHFYTTDVAEIGTTAIGQAGQYGYRYEGVACYVLPYYE